MIEFEYGDITLPTIDARMLFEVIRKQLSISGSVLFCSEVATPIVLRLIGCVVFLAIGALAFLTVGV